MTSPVPPETVRIGMADRRAAPRPSCGASLAACKACGKCPLSALLDAIAPVGDNDRRDPN